MIVFVTAFVVMLLVIAAMAVGAMAGRKPIGGSCGGMSAVGVGGSCGVCGRTVQDSCSDTAAETDQAVANTKFYDASNN